MHLTELESFSILPLIDWHTARPDLCGEAGVSYLIRVNGKQALFDLGLNRRREHPSPLLRNMTALDVPLSEIDALVISHHHLDHVGGLKAQKQQSYRLSSQPTQEPNWRVFTPQPFRSPTRETVVVTEPTEIIPGLWALPPLTRKLWLMGNCAEMILVAKPIGSGPVAMVGCGHPGIPAILDQVEAYCGEPPATVVGGLHYPVNGSRLHLLGIPLQKYFGIGPRPFPSLTLSDARHGAETMRRRGVERLALSGHDSTDEAMHVFEEFFGDNYETIEVGREIQFAPAETT